MKQQKKRALRGHVPLRPNKNIQGNYNIFGRVKKMEEEIPQGYNVGWEVVGDRAVTTAAVPRSSMYGGYRLDFETIIWYWDGQKRGRIVHMIHHRGEKTAKKVHGQIVDSLKAKI